MRTVQGLIAGLAAVLALSACATPQPAEPADAAVTILISVDGMRPDYLERGVTPNLNRLADQGVRGEMRPSFPSKTFPNHYTLVTGLRPDHHGVVDNNMEDPAMPGVRFSMSNTKAVEDPRWWNGGTPIWVSAERAGVRAATMFWPGSDAPIHGVYPDYWLPYDQAMTAQARVDKALAWLDLPPSQRPRLETLYFEAVDTEGHHHGPRSAEATAAAAAVDAAVGRLEDGLKARRLTANIIVVADHGMAEVSPDRRIVLDDLLPATAYRIITSGAFLSVFPTPGHEAEVDRALIQPHARMECWRKAEIPARFHYGSNPRVPPYFCLPQTGWEITTRDWIAKHPRPDLGNHGFDPYSPEMRAVFVANGPAFRRGVTLPVFDNVDVYPLLARLLKVKAEPNDGNLGDIAGALR